MQRFGVLEVADGIADFKSFDTHQRTDVARRHFGHLHAAHALECMQFLDFGLDDAAVAFGQRHVHALAQCTAVHAAHGDTAGIGRIVQRRHQHLRRTLQLLGSRNVFDDAVQERRDVVRRLLPVGTHPVVLGRTVDDREIQLFFCGIEAEHQVEYHFVHFLGATVGFVHLIHHHDGFQANLKRLLEHEARLRHWSFESVDQQDAAIGHIEHTFYLAAEVAVPRSINNVDFGSFIVDGNVLRQNRYPSFAFQVIVIQH